MDLRYPGPAAALHTRIATSDTSSEIPSGPPQIVATSKIVEGASAERSSEPGQLWRARLCRTVDLSRYSGPDQGVGAGLSGQWEAAESRLRRGLGLRPPRRYRSGTEPARGCPYPGWGLCRCQELGAVQHLGIDPYVTSPLILSGERRCSLGQQLYYSGEFARRAGVSVRTLRFYDHQGLLSPSHYSKSGYRLYSDDDLAELQQILALKFLGFTLGEIKRFMKSGPGLLPERLARQKAMMRDRQAQIDAILRAIEHMEELLREGRQDREAIAQLIEVTQMEKKNEWVNKYFTPDQQETMNDLADRSYSDEAKDVIAAWGEWTEEDQRRVDAQYAHIADELKRLVAEGQDPAGAEAQAVAKLQTELLAQFTHGNSEVTAGLNTWWQNFSALPAEQKPPVLPWSEGEDAFLREALKIYSEQLSQD